MSVTTVLLGCHGGITLASCFPNALLTAITTLPSNRVLLQDSPLFPIVMAGTCVQVRVAEVKIAGIPPLADVNWTGLGPTGPVPFELPKPL